MTTDASATADDHRIVRFEAEWTFPIWSTLLAIVSVVWIAMVVLTSEANDGGPSRPEYLLFSLLPLALANAAWRSLPPVIEGELTPEGLTINREFLPLDRIRAVLAPDFNPKAKRDRGFAIFIHDVDGGIITLPKRLTLPSIFVFEKLSAHLPPSGARTVSPLLTEYLERNEAGFGNDRILSYVALKGRMKERKIHNKLLNYGFAIIASGIVFLTMAFIVEARESRDSFGIFGSGCIVVGLVTLLGSRITRKATLTKKLLDSSLVITPLGLALIQEDLRGELIWSQILDVAHTRKVKHFTLARRHRPTRELIVKVDGADIPIIDIYDRPLGVIHEQIVRYWRPRFDAAAFDPTARPESARREDEVVDEIEL